MLRYKSRRSGDVAHFFFFKQHVFIRGEIFDSIFMRGITLLLVVLLAPERNNAIECEAGYEGGTLEILRSSEPDAACSYKAYPCDFKRPCQFSLTKISSPEKLGRCTADTFVECYCKSDKCNTNFELLLDSWVNSDVKNKTLLECMTKHLEYLKSMSTVGKIRSKKNSAKDAERAMRVMDNGEEQTLPRTRIKSASKNHPRGKKDTELKTGDKSAQTAASGVIELPKTGQERPPSDLSRLRYNWAYRDDIYDPELHRWRENKSENVPALITAAVPIILLLMFRFEQIE